MKILLLESEREDAEFNCSKQEIHDPCSGGKQVVNITESQETSLMEEKLPSYENNRYVTM